MKQAGTVAAGSVLPGARQPGRGGGWAGAATRPRWSREATAFRTPALASLVLWLCPSWRGVVAMRGRHPWPPRSQAATFACGCLANIFYSPAASLKVSCEGTSGMRLEGAVLSGDAHGVSIPAAWPLKEEHCGFAACASPVGLERRKAVKRRLSRGICQ